LEPNSDLKASEFKSIVQHDELCNIYASMLLSNCTATHKKKTFFIEIFLSRLAVTLL